VLYAALPNGLLIGPRYVVPGLELILFIPLVLANPRRMSKQNRLLRRLSIALMLLIAVSNLAALVLLIRSLVIGQATAGGQLLGAAGHAVGARRRLRRRPAQTLTGIAWSAGSGSATGDRHVVQALDDRRIELAGGP